MNKHNKKLYTVLLILIIFLFSAFWAISYFQKKENAITTPSKSNAVNPPLLSQGGIGSGNSLEPKTIPKNTETQKNKESITILAGDTTAHLLVAPNTLFYNALVEGKNADKITFSGKNYPGLGFFVTEIGTLRAGDGKNLLYYINGKEATVGVSSYTLKDGDIIEWKLE